MVPVLSRLSVGAIIAYFLVYLAGHIVIGLMKNNAKKELATSMNIEEATKKYKLLCTIFRWFPVVYVVFLILALGT